LFWFYLEVSFNLVHLAEEILEVIFKTKQLNSFSPVPGQSACPVKDSISTLQSLLLLSAGLVLRPTLCLGAGLAERPQEILYANNITLLVQ
jgi:hypothetical protein